MKKISFIHFAILIVSCFILHSGNYQHDYLLDSGHLIPSNPSVRSLAYIPQYFLDPSTLTSLRQNWDYRPVLQVTYALNYAISHYDTWSWHFTQILLHSICAIGLYLFCHKLLAIYRPVEQSALREHLPFVAALLFAIHPYTSGVVNYFSARSSLLVSAFLLCSLPLYMRSKDSASYAKPPWGAVVLYALALFTKIEAVAALGVYGLFEIVRQPSGKPDQTVNKAAQGPSAFSAMVFYTMWRDPST